MKDEVKFWYRGGLGSNTVGASEFFLGFICKCITS